jgi:anaerobic selenocysteine-containing dehydrogenase
MRTAEKNSRHYRACNLCEAMCGIEIAVQADERLDIRGDKDDPFSRGYICPKAAALGDLHYDKDRLRYPVRRTPDGWQRLAWDEAFDEVAHSCRSRQKFHRHVSWQSHRS